LLRRTVLTAIEPPSTARHFFHLSGCGLNTLDVIDLQRRLPAVVPGELLALCDAGAYSISRACRYTGLSPAVIVLGVDGSLRLARRPETVGDLMGPMTAAAPGVADAAGASSPAAEVA
jgi:hypothetical protein